MSSRPQTRVYVDDWEPAYGSPYLVDGEDAVTGRLVEDGEALLCHPQRYQPEIPHQLSDVTLGRIGLAFVDGVRRGEASLFQFEEGSGRSGRGVAGSHACGVVLALFDGSVPTFGPARIERVAVWGSGLEAALPSIAGWSWRSVVIADDAPEAPLRELQERMRLAEANLAEEISASGFLTLVDGPLHYVRSRDLPVVGYIKTHHRALLPPAEHAKIPALQAGERTSLFIIGTDRYSTYLRLARTQTSSSPWSGIVRLEVPQSAGLDTAVRIADAMAGMLPRFAGVLHRDPRAPQNLQPVGALESHLRHLLGSAELARRAVREAVARSEVR